MSFSSFRGLLVAVALMAGVLFLATPNARAATVTPVGTGDSWAGVVVQFQNGHTYAFQVFYTGPTTTGINLLDILDSGLGADFTLTAPDFPPFGRFVDGIGYLTDSNSGYGGGDNWWHYWTKDAGAPAWYLGLGAEDPGATTRVIHNGDLDGWVYGSETAPSISSIPEPTAILILGTAVPMLLARRRTRR
ncbi:MAG: hypothetical protein K8S99_03095 [Planctomycetes bacterium]|nr:hypothetical protein [Planctomycetota bacterium]